MAVEIKKHILPIADIKGFYQDEDQKAWGSEEYCSAVFFNADKHLIKKICDESAVQRVARDASGKLIFLFDLEIVSQKLKEGGHDVPEFLATEKEKTEEELEGELRSFADEVSKEKSVNAEEYATLISLFGASNAVDILLKYHPEYQGLPVERVRKILAEYLGDFLLRRRSTRVKDQIEKYLVYLDDERFRENVYEVLKQECFADFNKKKKEKSTLSDHEIIEAYLQDVLSTSEDKGLLSNPHFKYVIGKVIDFYSSVFKDFKKPNHVVDRISEKRDFPDINQLINFKEISEKKRMLIADEMGLGKSASVILSKEALGLKTALVVVPSSVVDTWKEYLSDTVGTEKDEETGEEKKIQKGYFKPDESPRKSPRVAIIENPQSIKNIHTDPPPEYIVISQEKLEDRVYIDALLAQGFDMLIVDEAHKLKNIRGGKRSKHIIELAKKIEGEDTYLALLSGTPVPNNIEDLAFLLILLHPEKFGDADPKKLIQDILHGEHVDLRSLLLRRMQMKSLVESLDLPEMHEKTRIVNFSEREQKIYRDVLMQEDELEAVEKMRILRKFCLNPASLEITPGIVGTKVQVLTDHLKSEFRKHDRIVVYVNDIITGVLRKSEKDNDDNDTIDLQDIIGHLRKYLPFSPEELDIDVIEGSTQKGRNEVIKKFQRQKKKDAKEKKILLLVSGNTLDVGVDLSKGDHVVNLNDPWTEYQRRQQYGRVYRPGVQHDIDVVTLIIRGTIEEGIHRYIGMKYRAIEKLLRGIDPSEWDIEALQHKDPEGDSLKLNEDLAKHYFSVWAQMMDIFKRMPNIGEQEFLRFIHENGNADKYAEFYRELGARNYQSNANRVAGTLIKRMTGEAGQRPEELKILDMASGPMMLRKYIDDKYQNQILSIDINEKHFDEKKDYFKYLAGVRKAPDGSEIHVGSFIKNPSLNDAQFDYVNCAFALHYTSFAPSRGDFERLELLQEMNRLLRVGGKAVISLIHSKDFSDETQANNFVKIVEALGFRIDEQNSGVAQSGETFMTRIFTLKKIDHRATQTDIKKIVADLQVSDVTDLSETFERSRGIMEGLKFRRGRFVKLRNTQRIIDEFSFNKEKIPINFNKKDAEVYQEEKIIMEIGEELRREYGAFQNIPLPVLEKNEFGMMLMGKEYIIFRQMKFDEALVVVK